MSAFDRLHPALQYHVVNSLGWTSLRPTQLEAIDPIQAGMHCLLLAPTAGGKTEAALMPVLSRMLAENWPSTSVLYLCPIKALLNNLEARLRYYADLVGRRVEVWHGDVADSRKRRIRGDPPDILLTTPESLEGMLVSTRIERAEWFGRLRAVIVDELHAFAGDDRGWHLRSVLGRIDHYAVQPLQRIGLSATVQNPDDLLAWLAPAGERRVVGSSQVSSDADVTIDFVGSLENAGVVLGRLYRGEKRLVFCDSRASAEHLGSLLNAQGIRTFVSHASLSANERKAAETAFAEERDCIIVATSTLELGIDVGDLDRVIQIDAPGSVSSFLQRMGRSGRRAGTRRSCLFLAVSTNGLLQALGVCQLWSRAWVEAVAAPARPWNVVAQQALLTTLEHGQIALGELAGRLTQAFAELPHVEMMSLLQHLTRTQYLAESAPGLLQVGPRAEQVYGRAHYRDLMATFSGSNLLLGRYGTQDVGYLDPALLNGDSQGTTVLLGGKSWSIRHVDFRRRTVALEPAPSGGKARWQGAPRSTSFVMARAIREVVRNGPADVFTLSRRARDKLDELRDALPTAITPPAIEPLSATRFRAWTWAGTRWNRTLANQFKAQGATTFDELSVQFLTSPAGLELTRPIPPQSLRPDEIEQDVVSIKFAELLPQPLLARLLIERLFTAPADSADEG